MKKSLTITLGLLAIIGGTVFAWQQGHLQKYLPENIASKLPDPSSIKIALPKNISGSIKAPELDSISKDASSQLTTLTAKVGELGNHAKNVLGSSVQVNEEDQPLHEKAIEYGQYVYCRQVVKEYEARIEN